MPRYFFHLAGQLKANDLLGQDCIDDREARDHASVIAHRIGTEKPQMVRDGNFTWSRTTPETRSSGFRWRQQRCDAVGKVFLVVVLIGFALLLAASAWLITF
jgi:hypothetical protein